MGTCNEHDAHDGLRIAATYSGYERREILRAAAQAKEAFRRAEQARRWKEIAAMVIAAVAVGNLIGVAL